MTSKCSFAVTLQHCSVDNDVVRDEFRHISEDCQKRGHALKLLQFMQTRIRCQTASFSHVSELLVPPLTAIISMKVQPYVNNSLRVFFTIFEETSVNLLSHYFDKVVIDIGTAHFEWSRSPDTLDLDGLEYIISEPQESPLPVAVALYPDFPVPYYIVPDHLREVTGTSIDFVGHILKSIIDHAINKSLFVGDDLICDEPLELTFGEKSVPINDIPHILSAHLTPVQPIFLNFNLAKESPRFNVQVTLPNFSRLIIPPPVSNSELSVLLNKFGREWERVELYAAFGRNPFEALEAEIAGHASMCELTDETNGTAPTESLDPMNPARRATPFYWQSWVTEHIPRFLEENKMIQNRYEESRKKPPRQKKSKKNDDE